jgi:hypothetical protein
LRPSWTLPVIEQVVGQTRHRVFSMSYRKPTHRNHLILI